MTASRDTDDPKVEEINEDKDNGIRWCQRSEAKVVTPARGVRAQGTLMPPTSAARGRPMAEMARPLRLLTLRGVGLPARARTLCMYIYIYIFIHMYIEIEIYRYRYCQVQSHVDQQVLCPC